MDVDTNISLKKKPSPELLQGIEDLLTAKGFKATTMDLVAASLGISKRTLYETFDNKEDMIMAVLDYMNKKHLDKIKDIFNHCPNTMEACFRICEYQIKFINSINIHFFRDMHTRFKLYRNEYDELEKLRNREMLKVFMLGIKQGVFRRDVNYPIQIRMLKVQMESLKRMEEIFPDEFTCEDILRSISLGFLRSIASPEGMHILDVLLDQKNQQIINPDAAEGVSGDCNNKSFI